MNTSELPFIVPRRKNVFRRIWLSRRLYLYILPALGLLLTFSYYPAISAMVHAFFKWDPFGKEEYIGLANFRMVYKELFTALPAVAQHAWTWTAVQLVAWLVPALLVVFFACTEWMRERAWRWCRAPAVVALLAAVVVTAASLVSGAWQIRSAMAGLEGEELTQASNVLFHLVVGHVAVIVLVCLQWLGWRRHVATRDGWWWRLLAAATAAGVLCSIGMLVRVTAGGDLRASCWNLFRVMTFSLTIGLGMPLLIALILFRMRNERCKYIYRVLFVIPMVVPGIVGLLMWQFIYDYNDGVLNNLIKLFLRPGPQLWILGLFGFVAAYVAVMKILGARRRGAAGVIPTVVLVLLAMLPLAMAVAYPLSGKDAEMSFAKFFVHYSIVQVFRNPWVHLVVLSALFVWLAVKAVKAIQVNRQLGANWRLPVAGAGILALVLLAALFGYAAQDDTAALGAAEFVSQKSGLGIAGSVELKIRNWLGDSSLALYSLMLMGFPWVGTVSMLIFYAGLQAIPVAVLDSARLDGATGLRRFTTIEFPLILGQFKLLLILGIIGGIQGFQGVLILTYGGPGKSTEMPGLLMFKEAYNYSHLGYGTTIGVVMFLVILSATYLNMKYIRPSGEEEAE